MDFLGGDTVIALYEVKGVMCLVTMIVEVSVTDLPEDYAGRFLCGLEVVRDMLKEPRGRAPLVRALDGALSRDIATQEWDSRRSVQPAVLPRI